HFKEMDRRDFVKQSCTMCLAIGAGLVVGSLSSCAPLPIYKTAVDGNKIAVPASLFTQSNFQVIEAKGLFYNIGLLKESDGTYTALLLRCTHADNQLTPTGNGFKCNLHGSAFDTEGHVTQGPAERPLTKYSTKVVHGNIIIHLS
ncbi:MAG TPA: Rieske (2Fe-2S) protein, partial [Mucilaginibacter sp.]|nr:Rieske (2Fe-2S) protein [Mucilaginibacter sp.]